MYIERQSPLLPDLYHEILPGLGLFEWNVLHSKKTDTLVSDLDGVICEDCAPEIDSNEELYCEWIKNAKPYLIPAFEIDVILSSRLEKYRHATEEWLNRHRVKYKKLILWDIPSKEERNFAKFKIDQLIKIKPGFIWESNSSESEQIWKATKTPTLCVDEMILFN